jgi:hypothetical protein
MAILEGEAAWRKVPLLQAIETARLPPKARTGWVAFADAIRKVMQQPSATVADRLSLVLEATGYRAMLLSDIQAGDQMAGAGRNRNGSFGVHNVNKQTFGYGDCQRQPTTQGGLSAVRPRHIGTIKSKSCERSPFSRSASQYQRARAQ